MDTYSSSFSLPLPGGLAMSGAGDVPAERWLTVSQLNEQIRQLLEDGLPFVRVRGEISDLHQPASGHLYFTLLDAQSRLRAVVWRSSRARLRVVPKNGDSVMITGRMALYPPRGEYQLVVEGLQPAGAGSERERFLQLFARLQGEGLFAEARKRPLPFLPFCIGVVTSATGAAIHDMVRVLEQRVAGYHLLLSPARVQGEGADRELVEALRRLWQDGRAEVIICGRGGGSAEDLSAFNSELLVRAIAASPVPVISAVGHEVDVTLADLVADWRAPTPSAAAERVMPEFRALAGEVAGRRQRVLQAGRAFVLRQGHTVHLLAQRLLHPRRRLELLRRRCDEAVLRIERAHRLRLQWRLRQWMAVQNRLRLWAVGGAHVRLLQARLQPLQRRLQKPVFVQLASQRWQQAEQRLQSLAPLAVLQRGYAIVYDQQGGICRAVQGLQAGDTLQIRLARGVLTVQIQQIEAEDCP
ncbi:MAG: exodeoxyribonuclease VII large subunit [Magnetococcales bacterium]|nr:exodeoxyribonuclease VII large subunit [Magnetococcales bacterium]